MRGIYLSSSAGSHSRRNAQSLWASEMVGDNPGGATGMNRFTDLFDVESLSARNAYHNAGVYTSNPDLWCVNLLPVLSGLVIAKDDCGTTTHVAGEAWHSRYGGVAITSQHVVYCSHAYPHAQGTASNGNVTASPATRLRFIDEDGLTVTRDQLHQAAGGIGHSNAANNNGAQLVDWCVAVLDSPLPASVRPVKLLWLNDPELQRDKLGFSQEWNPETGGDQPPATSPLYDYYPRHNRQMLYISSTRRTDLPEFSYGTWGGDSGTPQLFIAGDQAVLVSLAGVGMGFGQVYDGWTPENRLNTLIGLADSYAVAAGRLGAPTGLTVAIATNPLTT